MTHPEPAPSGAQTALTIALLGAALCTAFEAYGTVTAMPVAAEDLGRLPALSEAPMLGRTEISLATSDIQTTLTALLDLGRERGVRLEALDARSASLERAFLALSDQDPVQSAERALVGADA